jgi:N-acetylmuramoyl-L-alanine amidase
MKVVVIDPGHGGAAKVGKSSANNATGPGGTKEKTLTLDLGLRLFDALQGHGHEVVLTRDADVNLDLKDRAAVAAHRNAAAFVSLHFNGNANPAVQGTETWVHSAAGADSVLLAPASSSDWSRRAATRTAACVGRDWAFSARCSTTSTPPPAWPRSAS